jgi:hypothetical protein
MMKYKRGGMLNKVVIHIVLVGLIFAIFLMANAGKVNARGVKQQIVEKQVALLIDAAKPGMSFEILKENVNGVVSDVSLKNGRVHATVEGFGSVNGYPYFTPHSVSVVSEGDLFRVVIK